MAFVGGSHNCWDACIAAVCRDNNIVYDELLLASAAFRYETSGISRHLVGEKIAIDYRSVAEVMEQAFGVRVGSEAAMAVDQWAKTLQSQCRAPGIIPVVLVDAFVWPPDAGYTKYHHPHFVIAKDVSLESRTFTAHDPFNNLASVEVSFEQLVNGVGSIYTIAWPTNGAGRPPDTESLVAMQARRWPPAVQLAASLEAFAKDLLQTDLALEVAGFGDVWWGAPLFNKIKRLITARRLWARTETAASIDPMIGVKLKRSVAAWDRLVVYLAARIRGDARMQRLLASHLRLLAQGEMELARSLSERFGRDRIEHATQGGHPCVEFVRNEKSFGGLGTYSGSSCHYFWVGHDVSTFDLHGSNAVPDILTGENDSLTSLSEPIRIDCRCTRILMLYADFSQSRSSIDDSCAASALTLSVSGLEVSVPLVARVVAEPHILHWDGTMGRRTCVAGQIYLATVELPDSCRIDWVEPMVSQSHRLLKLMIE